MKIHEVKIWQDFFDDAASGAKPFEVRLNDRDYKVGDLLLQREWLPGANETGSTGLLQGCYGNRSILQEITYVYQDTCFEAIKEDYVVLAVKLIRVNA